MLYREAGQFKTSYAADMAMFPILQDRIGIAVILAVAFIAFPLSRNEFPAQAVMIPFLIFSLAAIGLNLLTGYTGLLSLGTGAFMGVGAYACYKLTTIFPRREHHRLDHRLGLRLGRGRRAVRPAVAAHQGLLSGGRDARGAVLPAMVLHPHSLALQLQRLGRDRGAAAQLFGVPITGADARLPRRAISSCSRIVVVHDLVRLEPRARAHRPHVDGGARHGHRRRADGHPAAAAPSCSPSRCRRSTAASPARCWCSSGTAAPKPTVFDINQSFFILFMVIIGGLGQPDRLVLRRGADLHAADRAAARARRRSAFRCTPRRSSTAPS